MGSKHLLRELDIAGREMVLSIEPSFDFYKIARVARVCIDFGEEDDSLSVELKAEYLVEKKYEISILMEGVRELVLPEMRASLLFSELEIEDVRERQLEGICFEIVDQFERSFRCSCRNITILTFRQLQS